MEVPVLRRGDSGTPVIRRSLDYWTCSSADQLSATGGAKEDRDLACTRCDVGNDSVFKCLLLSFSLSAVDSVPMPTESGGVSMVPAAVDCPEP